MNPATNTYRVFFSHSGEDAYLVDRLFRPQIERTGASLFVDTGRVEFGDDFRSIVIDQLSVCNELVVLLTPSALARPWVFAEIGAAVVQRKRVVAMRYGPSNGDLQARGIMSILGTTHLMPIDYFDQYLTQLQARINDGRKNV